MKKTMLLMIVSLCLFTVACNEDNKLIEMNKDDNQMRVVDKVEELVEVEPLYLELGKYSIDLNEALDEGLLNKLNIVQIKTLRNAYFAKYGYEFNSYQYSKFFSRFDWYEGKSKNVNDFLTDLDQKNIDLVKSLEETIEYKYDFTLTPVFNDADDDFKWGYVNEFGDMFIDYSYDRASNFEKDYAVVTYKGKSGIIDRLNQFVVEPIYDALYTADDGLFYYSNHIGDDYIKGFVNLYGEEIVIEDYGVSTMISDGFIPFTDRENNRQGFMNYNGQIVHEAKYDMVGLYSDGLAAIMSLKGNIGYINTEAELVIPSIYMMPGMRLEEHRFVDGLAYVAKDGQYFYINRDGEKVIDLGSNYAGAFSDGLAQVTMDGFVACIDREGHEVIPPIFTSMTAFSQGYAFASRSESESYSYGIINKKGEFVSPEIFYVEFDGGGYTFMLEWTQGFRNGIARTIVYDDGPSFVCVNTKGEIIWELDQ